MSSPTDHAHPTDLDLPPEVVDPVPTRFVRLVDWVKSRERTWVLAAMGLQFLLLFGLLAARLAPIVTGRTVLVRVVPIDPRNLMRGDYVILGYEFSRNLPPGSPDGVDPSRRELEGRTVYTILVPEPDGRHWRADRTQFEKPDDGTFLRGTVRGFRVDYGIDSYFVQEGTGHDYEAAIRRGNMWAELSVDSSGTATVRGLEIE